MVTEFCGTPAPQVVSQPAPAPTGALGFRIHKETLESDRESLGGLLGLVSPICGRLGGSEEGAVPGQGSRGGGEGREPWFSNWKHIS